MGDSWLENDVDSWLNPAPKKEETPPLDPPKPVDTRPASVRAREKFYQTYYAKEWKDE